jgi:hypothetical protein
MIPVRSAFCFAVLFLFLVSLSFAEPREGCEVHTKTDPMLCSYEPNTLGYTHDSDDTGFMDFTLSARYQLFPDTTTRFQNWVHRGLGSESALYAAFTGRFGQYIGTRDSSPVVGKRFNPKMFYRYWTDKDHESHVDFAFLAHESNGQSIDSPAQYEAALAASTNPHAVDDQLSRGWDYLELSWQSLPVNMKRERTLSASLTFKYFLLHGPLQGRAEEYNAWENNPQGKPRSHVNGLSGAVQYVEEGEWAVFQDLKVSASYETGYREPFRFSTYRFEAGSKFLQLPLTLWWQTGYNSDLAHYYKKVYSYGIEIDLGSF